MTRGFFFFSYAWLRHSPFALCLLALCILALWLFAQCLLVLCLFALCPLVLCLLALCLLTLWLFARCLAALCLFVLCLLVLRLFALSPFYRKINFSCASPATSLWCRIYFFGETWNSFRENYLAFHTCEVLLPLGETVKNHQCRKLCGVLLSFAAFVVIKVICFDFKQCDLRKC